MLRNKLFVFILFICLFLPSSISHAEIKIANDPTQLSVGARVLGMGRAFSAISDDPAAIFINPAGIGQVKNWQISSMSGKYLNDFDYVQLSALYPTDLGTFGIGYGGSSIEFVMPSSETVVIGGETRLISSGEVRGKYANTALLLSYGNEFSFWRLKNLYLGGSLKFLSQELSATGINVAGNASGMEMNVGALYPLRKDLSLALTVQNALPATLGGKITWSTNTEEILPTIAKVGLAYNLLGKKGTIKHSQELSIAFDVDNYLNRGAAISHVGFEWSPNNFMDLRFGLDQEFAGSSSSDIPNTNLSYGVGIYYNGFRFDYAYHAYNSEELSDNATSYFSVSYGIWKTPPLKKALLSIKKPSNQSVIYTEKTTIKGKILDNKVKQICVQNKEVKIGKDKTFTAEATLKLGKNPIIIETYDKEGKLLQKLNWKILRLTTFKDLKADYWAKISIEQLATLGIITGYSDKTFKPYNPISRAEITSLLAKVKGLTLDEIKKAPYSDVPVRHWAVKYITGASRTENALKEKLITGYPDGTFKPKKTISRVEGITLITRFAEIPKPRLLESPYKDLPGRHWAAEKVTAAKEAGLLGYIKGEFLGPNIKLTRGEAAYILAKTKLASARIYELMDFNTGYEEWLKKKPKS